MGYTNYWQQPDFTNKEWDKIKEEYKYIKDICEPTIKDESTSDDEIVFNGTIEHETFTLFKNLEIMESKYNRDYLTLDNPRFNFCKTARKPYDIAVWHLLFYANHISKNKLKISRDR